MDQGESLVGYVATVSVREDCSTDRSGLCGGSRGVHVWRMGLGQQGASHVKGMVEERTDRGGLSGASGRIIRRKTYAMPTMSRLSDQRSFHGPASRKQRDGLHRVALFELWRHHRPRHCAPSSVGSEHPCEIEAALVGRHAYAFRFVKKQKCGHVHVIQDRPPHIQRSVGLSSRSVRMPGGCIACMKLQARLGNGRETFSGCWRSSKRCRRAAWIITRTVVTCGCPISRRSRLLDQISVQ